MQHDQTMKNDEIIYKQNSMALGTNFETQMSQSAEGNILFYSGKNETKLLLPLQVTHKKISSSLCCRQQTVKCWISDLLILKGEIVIFAIPRKGFRNIFFKRLGKFALNCSVPQ
jgi:hypothetical protein